MSFTLFHSGKTKGSKLSWFKNPAEIARAYMIMSLLEQSNPFPNGSALNHIITTNNYSLMQFLLIYFVIVMCVILLLLCVCSLISGPRRYPGIFVDYVRRGSISAEVGLMREDQILSINDIPFNNVTIQQVIVKMSCFKYVYKCDLNHNIRCTRIEQDFSSFLFVSSGYIHKKEHPNRIMFLVVSLPGSLWYKQDVYGNWLYS